MKTFKIDDEYGILTEPLLRSEYEINGLTDTQIANKYGVKSKTTVWRRRRFWGIGNKYPCKSNQNASVNRTVVIALDVAKQMLSDGKTHQEMAELLGASRLSVFRRLKELGLTKAKKHSQNNLRWHVKLTEAQNKFLVGTLLGDGSLEKRGLFVCSHSIKQRQYAEHKVDVMRSLLPPDFHLIPTFPAATPGGKTYPSVQVKTQQNRELRCMRGVFYPDGVKVFPYEYLKSSLFDASSLAYWYMDDGSRKGNSAELFTYGFGFAGNAKILAFLKEKFNLIGILSEDHGQSRSPDARHYIRFNKDEAAKLFSIVAPHIAHGMEYKIPPEYRLACRPTGLPPAMPEI